MAPRSTKLFTPVYAKEISPQQLPSHFVTRGASVLFIEEAEKFFAQDDPAMTLARVLEVLSWTDWDNKLERGVYQHCGLVLGFPWTSSFQTNIASLELVVVDTMQLVALNKPYHLYTAVHNVEKQPGLTSRSIATSPQVTADFVFNKPDPIVSYEQYFNRLTYSRFGLAFQLPNDHFILPSGGIEKGFIRRDGTVRSPEISQLYFLTIGDDNRIKVRAYSLSKMDGSDEDLSRASKEINWQP